MATLVVGCMYVQIAIVEPTGIKQIQDKSGVLYYLRQFLLVANMLPW